MRYTCTVALTHRDHDLLTFAALHKAAPLHVLARRFFAVNPTTGKVNTDPEHACRRRLSELQKLGFIRPVVSRGKDTLVTVTARAADALGLPRPGSVATRGRAHHIATMQFLQDLSERYARDGVALVNIKMDFQLRAEVQQGKQTRVGDEFETFPDATFELERTTSDGTTYREHVAIEYVTSKYSDKDIISKAESFERFDNVVWFSDTKRTASRVAALTGRPSEVLS
jgi:hypothetical protein